LHKRLEVTQYLVKVKGGAFWRGNALELYYVIPWVCSDRAVRVGEADRGRGRERHATNRGGGALTGWGAGFLPVGARARAYYGRLWVFY